MKMKMNFIVIATIFFVIFVIFGTLPYKIKLDKSNNLELKTYLGIKTKIPVSDISIKEIPQGALNNLVRVFGTHLGNKYYGKFKNIKLNRTFFLFIIKSDDFVYFEYNGEEYIVNKWD